MQKVIGATLIAAAALAGTAALAETAASDQRAKLNALWGKDVTPSVSALVSSSRGDQSPTFERATVPSVERALRNLRSSQPSRSGR